MSQLSNVLLDQSLLAFRQALGIGNIPLLNLKKHISDSVVRIVLPDPLEEIHAAFDAQLNRVIKRRLDPSVLPTRNRPLILTATRRRCRFTRC